MTGNCLFDPFVLKYIHIYSYFVKKRDSYKIFRLSMKISWEPGSQVPRHYPTLASRQIIRLKLGIQPEDNLPHRLVIFNPLFFLFKYPHVYHFTLYFLLIVIKLQEYQQK